MTHTILDSRLQARIDEKLAKLNSLRPLSPSAVTKLREQFSIEMTYNSNAIEGNSLTLKETAWIIKDGLTIKGKPLRDHLEARDHYQALGYLYELIEKGPRQTVSEVLIRNLHKLVVRETESEDAENYRQTNVMITGSDHFPPDSSQIPSAMSKLVEWLRANTPKLHPIELAALIHHKLVYIHPFIDGNGRTARLAMNLILLNLGYPLVVILKNDRRKYYRVLALADKGGYLPLVSFVAQAVERSLNIYLKTLSPQTEIGKKYQPLSSIAKFTSYSGKYLNLLARFGKIEAHKEKRVWVTTQDAVEKYIKNRQRQRELKFPLSNL